MYIFYGCATLGGVILSYISLKIISINMLIGFCLLIFGGLSAYLSFKQFNKSLDIVCEKIKLKKFLLENEAKFNSALHIIQNYEKSGILNSEQIVDEKEKKQLDNLCNFVHDYQIKYDRLVSIKGDTLAGIALLVGSAGAGIWLGKKISK